MRPLRRKNDGPLGLGSWVKGICCVVLLVCGLVGLFLSDGSNTTYLSTELSSFLSDVQNSYTQYSSVSVEQKSTSSAVEAAPSVEEKTASAAASNSTRATLQQPATLSGALLGKNIWAETVWTELIQEASNLKSTQGVQDPGVFMEVGMFRALQCLQAANAGLEAHCVEPSAANFDRVQKRVVTAPEDVRRRIHLHHVAAGSVSGRTLQFFSGGGSGDRVGHVDAWKMEQTPEEAPEPSKMTEVTEMRMDDIVTKQPQGAFLIKIDTQGFEPHVFSGLSTTLMSHKAKYILLEYWPKGMDLMTAKLGECSSQKVLQQLANAGYKLYQLPVTAHPAAPQNWKTAATDLPLDDLAKNCHWYYEMEQRFPSETYKMGYWSDVLAVAPEAHLAQPVTNLGKLLHR